MCVSVLAHTQNKHIMVNDDRRFKEKKVCIYIVIFHGKREDQ